MDSDKTFEENDTKFAPSPKASMDDVRASYHALKSDQVLTMFQEAMPDLALIVNKERQLVYANSHLIKFLDIRDIQIPLGQRFGNLIDCIHAKEEPNGCGTSKSCRFCGIVNAILQSQSLNRPIVKEARVTSLANGTITPYELKIKASPLIFHGEEYTIISISDISDKKRLAALENSYMNEVFNTASELNEVVSSINKQELDEKNLSIIETAEKVKNDLMEDLLVKKMFADAEEGVLNVNATMTTSSQIINELQLYFSDHDLLKDKKIFADPFSHCVKFKTDTAILNRALINLLINALEATDANTEVTISAKLKDRFVLFLVHNRQEMAEEVKHQVFQRSFSTKDSNRGLGLYTARLLVTTYLKGGINFKSDKSGTTFIVEVPLSVEF